MMKSTGVAVVDGITGMVQKFTYNTQTHTLDGLSEDKMLHKKREMLELLLLL